MFYPPIENKGLFKKINIFKKSIDIFVRLCYNDIVKRLRRLQVSHKAEQSAKGGGKMTDYIILFLVLSLVLEILREIKK